MKTWSEIGKHSQMDLFYPQVLPFLYFPPFPPLPLPSTRVLPSWANTLLGMLSVKYLPVGNASSGMFL